MKADTKLRPLTVAPSKTNEAHDYWYASMTPIQRFEMMNKFKDVKGNNNKLTACLNYIEDYVL